EPLADSFDPANAGRYVAIMREWGLAPVPASARIPGNVETVYVLSRVTLGADIKIASIVLDAMKRRFPAARIVFVGGRKSRELFEADSRLEFLEAEYPRSGPVSERIAFGRGLRARFTGANRIVIDPDSRMTQLGLIEVCEPEAYFHFPSRSIGGTALENLTDLTNRWLKDTFGVTGKAFVAPRAVPAEREHPAVAISLGVGQNESKRVGGDFETRLIAELARRYRTVWIDRGAGGEEARRVTAAVQAAGVEARFWDGSFAGFASIVGQCDFYVGYDSAGQHAAAALRVPLITVFAGAPSEIFRARWRAQGPGSQIAVNADDLPAANTLRRVLLLLPRTSVQIDSLGDLIRAVFPSTVFTGGVTTCSCEECTEVQSDFGNRAWKDIAPEVVDRTGSQALFTVEAMAAFLPLFLIRGLEMRDKNVVLEFGIYSLTADVDREEAEVAARERRRLAELRKLLTSEQVTVVREWLYAAAAVLPHPDHFLARVDAAATEFWTSGSAN
ncbi:MAG: hypothetical protein KGN84_14270, partial [Acidobacteriota bacterium]|nr:hypothetical protein [Acidobacteriota bacterium]